MQSKGKRKRQPIQGQKMEKHNELTTGVYGDGSTKWMVVTVDDATGRWLHVEEFRSKSEAESWKRWSCVETPYGATRRVVSAV